MVNFINNHLSNFNPSEPMFWRMKLSYADFCELEAAVADASDAEMMAHPVAALCYLAEWYKWRYAPGHGNKVRHFNPTSEQIRQLLADAGIDADRWVAVNPETGRHSWLYSVYVLGGLPVAHELSRRADNRFLRQLCSLYHGSFVSPSGKRGLHIDDSGRAEAFRLSLKEGGSLNLFIREIVNGNAPFAQEDIKDGLSPASRLIQRIIDANNEVLRDKFRLEWRIYAPPLGSGGSMAFSRRLCLNLLPEITGEGLNQYLMYDRVMMWGFENPAELRWIEIGVDFLHRGNVVVSMPNQITYTNNYNPDRGFLSVGVEQCKVLRDVPVADFDTIVITAKGANGECHEAQRFDMEGCMQLYATDVPDEWSNTTRSQRATAVLWTAPWRNVEPLVEGLTSTRPFRNRKDGIGKRKYHLTLVPESFTLCLPTHNSQDWVGVPPLGNGGSITFYDHQGTDTLTARRHDDTVRYIHGDKVRCRVEIDDEEDEILLPLLMTREDVVIRRLTEDEFGEIIEEFIEPDTIEWKDGARFTDWTEETAPPVGVVKIRCMVRGRLLVKEFAYIGGEIIRDLDNREITMEPPLPSGGTIKLGTSKTEIDFTAPASPFIPCHIKHITVDVWQPLRYKEINRGDNCYYRTEEERFAVPAMTANELWVAVFGERGYQSYNCLPLIRLYAAKGENKDKVAMLLNAREDEKISLWTEKATNLDAIAPPELDVVMAYPNPEGKGKWLLWDFNSEHEPTETDYNVELGKATVLFQDLREASSPTQIYAPKRRPPGPWDKIKCTPLDCFKIAAKYKAYYFLFSPLEKLKNADDFNAQVYSPLLEEYNGNLPIDLKNELTRAAIELGFLNTTDQS